MNDLSCRPSSQTSYLYYQKLSIIKGGGRLIPNLKLASRRVINNLFEPIRKKNILASICLMIFSFTLKISPYFQI